MASFENTLSRMKDLYTYGKDLNESKKTNAYSLEHSAVAADGVTYGIVRECNKYYIKKAQTGKETIAESYEYLGGFCNKGNHEYTSYNNALKNFELKLASINEAHEGNVIISTLDPFKKGEFIVEATDKMKDAIARQRQIMHNVNMLMNESTDIGASRKNDVVKFDGKNPEAETGKRGDEEMKNTNANPSYAGSKTNGVDKKVGPFNNEPKANADQLKEACDCGDANCDCDWGSEGIGKGRDPKQIGWEIEGQTIVNESDEDWASQGLPSTPGVGEADTDHNNAPFNKTVNESEEDEMSDVESDDMGEEDFDMEGEDDFEMDGEDDFADEDFDMEGDEDFDMEGEDDFDVEGDFEAEFDSEEDDDIMARISALEAELESLKNMVNGDEMESMDDMEDDVEGEMELDVDAEGEEDFDMEGEDDFETEESFEPEMDECGSIDGIMENIINKVVSNIISEEKLNVWGKHPGYQKKPMELPTTGQDKNQWGEDWNDESVYSEQPFGTKIGSSAPFDKLVDTITKDVMSQLSGEAFNKKKVE
jgi:hypothetical protein